MSVVRLLLVTLVAAMMAAVVWFALILLSHFIGWPIVAAFVVGGGIVTSVRATRKFNGIARAR